MITERQKTMLTHLSKVASLSAAGMIVALETGRAQHVRENIAYNLSELCLKGLAEIDESRDKRWGAGYCITPLGMAALFGNGKAEPAKAQRITIMKLPRYSPPAKIYVRNNGHVNIQSRGFA